jgi:hypothetical protein
LFVLFSSFNDALLWQRSTLQVANVQRDLYTWFKLLRLVIWPEINRPNVLAYLIAYSVSESIISAIRPMRSFCTSVSRKA